MDSGFGASSSSAATSNTRHDADHLTGNNVSSSQNKAPRAKRSVSPRAINARMDTNQVRRIIDANIVSRESIKQAIEARLNANPHNDFITSFELAQAAYALDKHKQDQLKSFRSLGQLLIANLPDSLRADTVRQFVRIKYGVQPSGLKYESAFIATLSKRVSHLVVFCRLVREQGSTNRTYCLLNFRSEDATAAADEIYRDLNGKPFPGTSAAHYMPLVFLSPTLK